MKIDTLCVVLHNFKPNFTRQLRRGMRVLLTTVTAKSILDVVFPPRCASCSDWCSDGFCAVCRAALQPIEPPFCERCGLPFDPLSTADIYANCRDNRYQSAPPFESLRSAYAFTGPLRPAVHGLKYQGKTALAEPMAALLHQYLMNQPLQRANSVKIPLESLQWIVPVPLHPLRRWRRGYNQSALLAKELAGFLNEESTAVYAELLVRTRYTVSQVELDRKHRAANVKTAFVIDARHKAKLKGTGGAALLIDDVATTGATLSECARVLKAGGCSQVYALTLARQP